MAKDTGAVRASVRKDHMELSFGPKWTYISCVRGFVANFFAIGLEDKAQAEKISLAISELLENAVKYSSGTDTIVRAEIHGKTGTVTASVENQSTPAYIKDLKGEIDKVCSGTPEEAYMAKLLEAASRTDGKSQIGLARVRYETGATLNLSVEGDTVRIEATFPLTSPEEKVS